MTITKEEFDSLQVGDELVNSIATLKVELKLPNVIIAISNYEIPNMYSLNELQQRRYQLKPKTKHLHGFPLGDYSDKNVFVSVSDISLENAQTRGNIAKLISVGEYFSVHTIIDVYNTYKYAILLSDNVELITT